MAENKCCGTGSEEQRGNEYETVCVEKTRNVCPLCEDYAENQASKPVAVMSCEGACLRGEVARRAANIIPEKSVKLM